VTWQTPICSTYVLARSPAQATLTLTLISSSGFWAAVHDLANAYLLNICARSLTCTGHALTLPSLTMRSADLRYSFSSCFLRFRTPASLRKAHAQAQPVQAHGRACHEGYMQGCSCWCGIQMHDMRTSNLCAGLMAPKRACRQVPLGVRDAFQCLANQEQISIV